MGADPRLTQQSLKVLKVFCEAPRESQAGADLMKATGLSSGTLYPILLRFENCGFLASKWEHGKATKLGRPRRRFYTLTGEGQRVALEALRELGAAGVLLPQVGRS
jgi:DNA-binding PadR family transcriptional regulator